MYELCLYNVMPNPMANKSGEKKWWFSFFQGALWQFDAQLSVFSARCTRNRPSPFNMLHSASFFYVVIAVMALSVCGPIGHHKRANRPLNWLRSTIVAAKTSPLPSYFVCKKSERSFHESEWWRWKTDLGSQSRRCQQLQPDDRSPNAQPASNICWNWYDKVKGMLWCVYAARLIILAVFQAKLSCAIHDFSDLDPVSRGVVSRAARRLRFVPIVILECL